VAKLKGGDATEKDATQRVLDLRQRFDSAKTQLTASRTQVRSAEDQLAAADDVIGKLGLDPDRDLERQVIRLVEELESDLAKLEGYADEVESILGGNK